jgi:hypothetical protein
MRDTAKALLRPVRRLAQRFVQLESPPASDDEIFSQQMQRSIANQYALFRLHGKAPYAHIRSAGFRVYSQFEEDGIILYVLAMIGFRSQRVVEMCCGMGTECMATNLILNHGFDGVLFDGNESNITAARQFFAGKHDCVLYPPVLKQAWITAENVNQLLSESGCSGEIDLLSLDLDGNDYWIWRALEMIAPRLIVVEAQNIIPADLALVRPYGPNFCYTNQKGPDFMGASTLAMVRLARSRGYRLIGAHRHGFNLFFLRNDEGQDVFPEVSAASVLDNHWSRWGAANRWPKVRDMPWIEVT